MRTDMRKPIGNSEEARKRASLRAKEILDNIDGNLDEGTDEFFIPAEYVPDGWTYEWKRKSVLEKEDHSHQLELARKGWEPVAASRHKDMMPVGYKGETIERKGMILMERPAEITEEVRRIEYRKAVGQVNMREAILNQSSPGQFERAHQDRSLVKVKKSFEPMPIPNE